MIPEFNAAIHYPFKVDRGLGRLMTEDDHAEHVDQLIRQLLFTNPGERVNRPDFGCGLRSMIFAPNSTVTAGLIEVVINESLEKELSSLIQVSSVKTEADQEKLVVNIAYTLKTTGEHRYLNTEVSLS